MVAVIFSIFLISGRSFIWNLDGAGQHYPILKKFHSFFWEGIHHPSQLGTWDFTVGLGADIYNTFSYYVFGDIFAYIALLFPASWLEFAYHLLIILRLYLAGLAFILFAKRLKVGTMPLLAGSLTYVFCGYLAIVATRHPMFIMPMIIMPFIFLGIEKIMEKGSPVVFILAIAGAVLSNFYFAYVLAILSFIYWLLRYHTCFKKEMTFIKSTLKLIGYGLIGVLLSSCLLVPTFLAVLSASRLGGDSATNLLAYSAQYYALLPKNLITTSGINQMYWAVGGYSSLILIVLPFIFRRRRKYPAITTSLVIGFIMMLIPVFGVVFNAMSTPSNRWTFALAFPISLGFMFFFQRLNEFDLKDFKRTVIVIVPFIFTLNFASYWDQLLLPLIILLIAVVMLYHFSANRKVARPISVKKMQTVLLILLGVNLCFTQMYYYLADNGKYLAERLPYGTIDSEITHAYDQVEEGLPRDELGRTVASSQYPKQARKMNYGMLNQTMSMESYYTVQPGTTYQLAQDLQLFGARGSIPLVHGDERTGLYSGLGVKYLFVDKNDNKKIPYGFELKPSLSRGETLVYESRLAKPFMSTTNQVMLTKDYERLSAIDKEQVFALYTIVDDLPKNTLQVTYKSSSKIIAADFPKDKVFDFQQANDSHQIKIIQPETTEGQELFLKISGLTFHPKNKRDGLGGLKDELKTPKNRMSPRDMTAFKLTMSNQLTETTIKGGSQGSLSGGQNSDVYLMNLGYQQNGLSDITLTSNVSGSFTYDQIEVIGQPYNHSFDDKIASNQEQTLSHIKLRNSYASADYDRTEATFLTTLVPYSKGWQAYVDGKKVASVQTNTAFLGFSVPGGAHRVELKYHTPGLALGVWLSFVGLIVFGVVIYRQKKASAT